MPSFVLFLTDFGLQDEFVGTCHGVIKRIAPEAQIVDVTHGIEPGRILQGALVLARTLPFLPRGVHLAVVDPGVGGRRRPIVLVDAEGRRFVGPDNGLLVRAAELAGPIAAAHELANETYALQPLSRTFHGRDLFAPVAAHLAAGVDPAELGPALELASLARLEVPEPELHNGRAHTCVLGVDRFGNLLLDVTGDELGQCGFALQDQVELDVRGDRYLAVVANTYSDARAGDLVLYEGSWGNVEVAVSGGDAAQLLRVGVGDALTVRAEAS